MPNRYDNAIFDVDGTLFNSYPGITDCLRHVYETLGTPVPDEKILRTFIGPSLYDSFARHTDWDEPKIARAIAVYRERYTGGGYKNVRFYPGIPELLADLQAAGVTLSVASSKPRAQLLRVLEYMGVADRFAVVSAPGPADDNSDKEGLIRAAVRGERPVMIGDRLYDIMGAERAGVDSIGVTFGFGGRAELAQYGATYIVDSTDEIYDIIIGETK